MAATMYTKEQLDIAILQQQCSSIEKLIERVDSRMERVEQKVDSHFHWTLGLIFGMYAMGLTGLIGALGHAYGWF